MPNTRKTKAQHKPALKSKWTKGDQDIRSVFKNLADRSIKPETLLGDVSEQSSNRSRGQSITPPYYLEQPRSTEVATPLLKRKCSSSSVSSLPLEDLEDLDDTPEHMVEEDHNRLVQAICDQTEARERISDELEEAGVSGTSQLHKGDLIQDDSALDPLLFDLNQSQLSDGGNTISSLSFSQLSCCVYGLNREAYLEKYLLPHCPEHLKDRMYGFLGEVRVPNSVPRPLIKTWHDPDPWHHVHPSIKPRFLEMVRNILELDPTLEESKFVAPTGCLEAPLIHMLHYPTMATSLININHGTTGDMSNGSTACVAKRSGSFGFRGSLVFDVIPYRVRLPKRKERTKLNHHPYEDVFTNRSVYIVFHSFTTWLLAQSQAKVQVIHGLPAYKTYTALSRSCLYKIFLPGRSPLAGCPGIVIEGTESISRLIFPTVHPESYLRFQNLPSINALDQIFGIACAITHRTVVKKTERKLDCDDLISGMVVHLPPFVLACAFYEVEVKRGVLFEMHELPETLVCYLDNFDNQAASRQWEKFVTSSNPILLQLAHARTPSFARTVIQSWNPETVLYDHVFFEINPDTTCSIVLDIIRILLQDKMLTRDGTTSDNTNNILLSRSAAKKAGLTALWKFCAHENSFNASYTEKDTARRLIHRSRGRFQRALRQDDTDGTHNSPGAVYDRHFIDQVGRPPTYWGVFQSVLSGNYSLERMHSRRAIYEFNRLTPYLDDRAKLHKKIMLMKNGSDDKVNKGNTELLKLALQVRETRHQDISVYWNGGFIAYIQHLAKYVFVEMQKEIPDQLLGIITDTTDTDKWAWNPKELTFHGKPRKLVRKNFKPCHLTEGYASKGLSHT